MSRLSRLVIPALCVAAPAGLQSCNVPDFRVVSIRPIYGWVDGCTPVSIGGSGFGSDVSVTVGGKALENLTYPDAETAPLDVGYEVYGTTPAADAAGYADVILTSGGQTGEVNASDTVGAFYYAACPLTAYPESADPSTGVAAGSTVTLSGCNLSADYQVRVGPSAAVPVTTVCKTATVSFSAPEIQSNGLDYSSGYIIAILDASGNQIFPDPASGCDTTLPVESNVVVDTGGEYNLCDGVPTVTYGGE